MKNFKMEKKVSYIDEVGVCPVQSRIKFRVT